MEKAKRNNARSGRLVPFWVLAVAWLFPCFCNAAEPVQVGRGEDGKQRSSRAEIFVDTEDQYSLEEIQELYQKGRFKPLPGAGSTGLLPGSVWSHFVLQNTSSKTLTLHLEYIDHQLIGLEAFTRAQNEGEFEAIADLSLARPFSHREIPHNRFVFSTTLAGDETREYFVKFSSDEAGFIFPSLRIWSPSNLQKTQNAETSLITFLIGGFFLMSLFALVAGLVIREKIFYSYSLYSFSKIIVWATILGFTHQYVITENYHWNFMSISGAVCIICGLMFARLFLQTRAYTPRLDYLLLFMIANACFLLVCALFRAKALAVISITIALLLYPTLTVVSYLRWRQGSKEAIAFCVAWSLLVLGLFVQALRDLGYVEHNFINYYWPPVASFSEMLGIMVAMGIKVQQLRIQKDLAEHKYMQHLEHSKSELENLVKERTRELERAKSLAEHEARTDSLTGISNRRSFFHEAQLRLKVAQRKKQPLSLLMFDIDHFKLINDSYGHAVGDEALRAFCDTIKKHKRESDIFGRLGGEEFALLLSEDRHGTLHTAQRLQTEICDVELQTANGPLHFTASVGIAYLQPGCDAVDQLLINADNALYVAKEKGRNQIIEHACPVDGGFSASNA